MEISLCQRGFTLPQRRTRPVGGQGARPSRLVASRHRVAASASPLRQATIPEGPSLPLLARLFAGAALLLPLAVANLGLGAGAAWARPPHPTSAPVAECTPEVIDESTGTAQSWLYSRGPWNQRQYGTIHSFYTDGSTVRNADIPLAAAAAATAPIKDVQQQAAHGAAAALAAAPSATRTNTPSASVPAPATAAAQAVRAAAAKAADTASGAARVAATYGRGLATRADQLGEQFSDALASVNLSDPQTQKSAAVVTSAALAMLLLAARQRATANGQLADAESSGDASDGESGSDADASASMSLEERQAEAARRITSAKQRIVEVKQQQRQQQQQEAKVQVSELAAEVTAKAAPAPPALELAAPLEMAPAAVDVMEAAAPVDSDVVAEEGGSIGKLTTDVAAAAGIAADQEAAAEQEQAQEQLMEQETLAPVVNGSVAELPGKMTIDGEAAAALNLPGKMTADESAVEAMALPGKMTADASASAAMADLSLERPGGRGGRELGDTIAALAMVEQPASTEPSLERPGGRGGREASDGSSSPTPVQAAAPVVDPALARPGGRGREMTAVDASPAAVEASPAIAETTPAAADTSSTERKKRWDPLSILLAPAAPLLAGLFGRGKSARPAQENKYDMMLDALSAAAAAPEEMADSRYDPVRSLLAATPSNGVPRYDFARSLLRGMAGADVSGDSPFDMARSLLQSMEPSGGSKYDPVYGLLKEATLLQKWGSSKYDPSSDLSDWVVAPPEGGTTAFMGLRYDPWADLIAAVQQSRAAVNSKYDPLAPGVGLRAAASSPSWNGPTGGSRYCMVAAVLDAAAGWEAPSGRSPYCPAAALFAAEVPTKASVGGGRFDPLAFIMDGWAAGSSEWNPATDGAGSRKYEPPVHTHLAKFDQLLEGDWSSAHNASEFSIAADSAASRGFGNGTQQGQQRQAAVSVGPDWS